MHVSRFATSPNCNDGGASLPLDQGELRVFRPTGASVVVPEFRRFCRTIGAFAVCSRDEMQLTDLPMAAVIPTGSDISSRRAEDLGLLVQGWSGVVQGGSWTDFDRATISGWLDQPIEGPAQLTVWGHAIASVGGGHQIISVSINGIPVSTWIVGDFEDIALHAEIPKEIDLTDALTIKFEIRSPVRPIERGMNKDLRTLGLWLT